MIVRVGTPRKGNNRRIDTGAGQIGCCISFVRRITAVSSLPAADIKWRNRRFFRNPDHVYTTEPDTETVAVRKIENVRNGDLRRVLRTFPTNEPLYVQCAHWIRAFAGKQFFPDANHRTAMLTLDYVLGENGIETPDWPGDHVVESVVHSKFLISNKTYVTFDNLWEKDDLYLVWRRHFVQYWESVD